MFISKLTVQSEHLDELNHVNNAVYVQWMEQVAKQHWKYLTKNQSVTNYVWMVLKHEIDYKAQAKLNDIITAKTWVGETKGATSERFIQFFIDEQLLVSSKTTWVLIDIKSQKPARITKEILEVLYPSL